MSVSVGQAQLHDALKALRAQWQQTRSQWKDDVAKEFEERYWNLLEGNVLSTLAALDRLEQVFIQLRNDCNPNSEQL